MSKPTGGGPWGGLFETRAMHAFNTLYTILTIIIVMGALLGTCAYLIYLERKISAYMQDRIGPNRVGPFGLLQPIADGVKFFLDATTNGNGAEPWVLFRASGTEPLLRIYAEAASPELVEEVLASAVAFVHSS